MEIISDLAVLRPGTVYWVPAVTAPVRDWTAAPGCRRGARFLLNAVEFRPAHGGFPVFESRGTCLRWIMEHRLDIAHGAPEALVTAARLDQWMLGLDAV